MIIIHAKTMSIAKPLLRGKFKAISVFFLQKERRF